MSIIQTGQTTIQSSFNRTLTTIKKNSRRRSLRKYTALEKYGGERTFLYKEVT